YHNPKYNSEYGIYSKNCGIQNIKLSFGHDEYLYIILKNNKNHNLSEKYINIIRFHSFYPWHTGKDYHYFMNDKDNQILKDVLNFNKYDLYSKNDNTDISPDVKKYYTNLLKTFFPEPLQW
ncbi:MAG: inositol oxygenase family protein, partial [Marinoscillum sp.]